MPQAIVTKHKPGSGRVTAKCDAGRTSVPWDDTKGLEANHIAAALALAEKLKWVGPEYGKLVSGTLPGTTDHAHLLW